LNKHKHNIFESIGKAVGDFSMGQREAIRQENNKTNQLAIWISIIAVVVSVASILISLYAFVSNNNSDKQWQQSQIKLLQEINNKLSQVTNMKEIKPND